MAHSTYHLQAKSGKPKSGHKRTKYIRNKKRAVRELLERRS